MTDQQDPGNPLATPRVDVFLYPGEHTGAYADVADTVSYGLRRLGLNSDVVTDLSEVSGRPILVGASGLSEADIAQLPANTIVYNMEHFSFVSKRPIYTNLLKRFEVWDYSYDNASRLPALINKEVKYVPLGFVSELARVVPSADEDIDVLFYGSINERRVNILNQLSAKGLKVHPVFGVYYKARDALIARAKVVLNMHFYLPGAFEMVRVSYLLANRKAVVAECNPGEFFDPALSDAFIGVPYDGLVDACEKLVADASRRLDLQQRGFELFSACDEATILSRALSDNADAPYSPNPTLVAPRRLNLGSGKNWLPQYLNLDCNPAWRPDVVADISDKSLMERDLDSARFGKFQLQRESFDEIIAYDVLEHIVDLVRAMTNCLALLCDGGVMRIQVPYDLSFGAWQDPTHLRAFNERSWWYYCEWFWYLGWTEARFDLMELQYAYSPLGSALRAQGTAPDEVARTPRAVDAMRVMLRKRALTAAEIAEGERWRQKAAT
jgi:SAM-dependent methyltransferase